MNARIALTCLAVVALGACDAADPMTSPDVGENQVAEAPPAHAANARTYEITVENLTSSGQPFTPPLVALHRRAADLFTVGEPASIGVQQIAENGNLGPMLGRLEGSRHVSSFAVGATPPVPPLEPGESVTLTLEASGGAQFVSMVSMLICTNDGFTGLDAAKLPSRIGQEVEWYADAYDAGTEINTEDFGDLVPPCPGLTGVDTDKEGTGMSDPALAEGGVIHHHPGVSGDGDLIPGLHGWENPVAQITVRRTS